MVREDKLESAAFLHLNGRPFLMEAFLPKPRRVVAVGNDLVQLARNNAHALGPFPAIRVHIAAHIVVAVDKKRHNRLSVGAAVPGEHLEPDFRNLSKRRGSPEVGDVACNDDAIRLSLVEIPKRRLVAQAVLHALAVLARLKVDVGNHAKSHQRLGTGLCKCRIRPNRRKRRRRGQELFSRHV